MDGTTITDSITPQTEVNFNKIKKGFWNEEGYYFNKEGKDKHGGYYDDNFNYIPGEGWSKENECYLSELEGDEDDGDFDDDYDGYDEDDLAADLEKTELYAFEKLIQEDSKKPVIQEDKKENTPVQKVETVEKIEEKPLKVENPPPKRNRLNDLFSNTPSDKPGKITKVT